MKTEKHDHPQVLVNLGNRYVVFGPSAGLPQKLEFDPEKDSEILPRVADESEIAEERILETLRVNGLRRLEGHFAKNVQPDLILVDESGREILIEIKVRDRDPKSRDISSALDRINTAEKSGDKMEVWHFNIERLNLVVQKNGLISPETIELPAIDVWEKTAEGIFNRERVVKRVKEWELRIIELYAKIQEWLSDDHALSFERTRTVTMSEELMQNFAVSDRELPILDIIKDEQVIASFVPRGLWVIGAWGRVDIITSTKTRMLVASKDDNNNYSWQAVNPDNRKEVDPLTQDIITSYLVNS